MDAPPLMDLLRRGTDYLAKRGIENARREAEWLFVDASRSTVSISTPALI